ncbi:phage tail tape measure protein [Brachybacterium squillarum]|uniref:phage tail tape measure protein n=1 Tax=Brachybacterium squillarum TaxID=661979 RepID=UPI0022217092|nr:phage tail tape measure protein [Brachybacterium squillarum]MCW1803878.1 phage tail tape measure protein [Brachybacterium squillarum]
MASAVELATAYISVAASGDSLAPSLGRSFRQVEKVAADSGKRMGKALTGEVEKATKQDVDKAAEAYEQASKQVAATAERQALKVESARRKEQIAQAKVTEALQKYDAESSQVLAAQDRLALASQKVKGAQLEQESAMERANKKLGEAKTAVDQAQKAADDAEAHFRTLGGRIESAMNGDFKGAFRGVRTESEKAADGVASDFDDAGDDAGAGMLDGLKGALLTGGAALGIGASFGELFQQGMESTMGEAKIQASLGLDDATADKLGKQAGKVYGGGFGESITETSDVVASAYQYLGPNVDTQWAAEMSLAMADAFGTEPQENIKAVSQMIRTGMVKDAQEGFDVLTKGYQSGADKAEDLTDTMTEYGTLFRGLGISGADAVGLMSQGLNAGARDADKVADAFKEFGIRAIDGSKTTTAAFKSLGLDSGEMATRIAAGGQSARDATQEVLEKLREVEDPAERSAIAVGLFGTQAEDLGGALYALDLDTAASGMGEIAGATQTMSDTMSAAQSPFERIQRSFSDIGTSLGGGMLPALNVFADVIIGVGEFFVANPLVFTILATGLTAAGVAAYFMSGAAKALFLSISTGIKSIPVIGWIIAGITLLVAALTWFFTKTELGQEIWAKVWGGIKVATAATVDWFMGTAWPALQGAWDAIAAAAVWLWQTVLVPVWDGIKAAIAATVDWMVDVAWPFLKGVWDAIATAALWLWQTIILPVWEGIRVAIAIAVTAVMAYIDLLTWYFNNVIAPVAIWLYESVIKPAWDGIMGAIGAVVAWFRDVAWPILKTAWDAVAAAGLWLWKSVLLPVWQGIQTAISGTVTWFRDVAWPILSTVIGWVSQYFESMKTGLSIIWTFIRDSVIRPVVTWFRDTAWPIISTIIDSIKSGFSRMRDSLRDAWGYVKDTVIAPVATWFRDTVGPLFDRITGGIKDAFETMKSAVEKAWQGIRDTAKVPVEFVVNKIINDAIIGNYNSVAETFGLDPIADVSLPAGWRRGGILPGYTPMAAGDDVLTPMRSGEGVLVSEGLRDPASRSAFLGANEAAKRGVSFADFLGLGYAGGGIVQLRSPFAGSYPRGDGFGARGGAHKGIDWPIPSGTVLKAVAAGVASRSWNPKAGNKLELSIGDGLVAGYHHLSGYIAKSGQSVGRGADVGYVGSTGRSSGAHLHFSLKRDGKYVDPAPYLGVGGEAGEGGGGGWWNPFASLWSDLKDKVREGVGDSAFGNLLFELPQKLISGATDWVSEKITGLGDWAGGQIEGAKDYATWAPIATTALTMTGSGIWNLNSMMRRMKQESGYDPNAVNNWDSNARRGTPSKGLMQVIQPTFDAYAMDGFDTNIFDPLSNMLASIRYTKATYGSLAAGWNRKGGYALGGIVDGAVYDTGGLLPSGEVAMNLSGRPEVVLNPAESKAYLAGQNSTAASRGERSIQLVMQPPNSDDPGTWARRAAETLGLLEAATAADW